MRLAFGTLVLLLFAAPLVGAQVEPDDDPFSGPAEYTVDVYLGEPGSPQPMAIYPHEFTLPPNSRVTFHVINAGGAEHDFSFLTQNFDFAPGDLRPREDNQADAVKTPLLQPGESYNLTVFFPATFTGTIDFICSVPGHKDIGMAGIVTVGAAAGEEAVPIEDYGVDYLAYWIGVISFIILFAVLFGTFFLFRYGESKNVTDHRTGVAKAQAEGGAASKPFFLPEPDRVAIVLAVIAIIVLAIIYL